MGMRDSMNEQEHGESGRVTGAMNVLRGTYGIGPLRAAHYGPSNNRVPPYGPSGFSNLFVLTVPPR